MLQDMRPGADCHHYLPRQVTCVCVAFLLTLQISYFGLAPVSKRPKSGSSSVGG